MLFLPHAELFQSPHHRHEDGGAIDHRDVDHLSLPGALRLEDTAHDPEGHEHAPAAEVTDQVDRRRRLGVRAPEVRERARQRDVVDVVARGLRHRTVLAPTGHASVDEPRVARETHVGAQPEPLGHARAEALEQRVGALDQPQHQLHAFRVLQIDADRAAATVERLEVRLVERCRVDLLGAVDAKDVGTHVGQQHARERSRSDAGELDDLDSCKRSHALKLREVQLQARPRPRD